MRDAKQKLREQDASSERIDNEPEDASSDAPTADQLESSSEGLEYVFDAERIVARTQGREGWLREARRQLEQRRWEDPEAIPRSRSKRLLIAAERLEGDLGAERRGNEGYERYRAQSRMKNGRPFGSPPKPYAPPVVPDGRVNLTDPDSGLIKAFRGFVQGYNAQAVVDQSQLVIAAEITTDRADWFQLDPMITAAVGELERAGVTQRPKVTLADSQYWNEEHIDEVVANKHIEVLIPPDASGRKQPRRGWTGGRYDWMRTVLSTDQGRGLYRRRIQLIEPVFAHTKHNRQVTRFHRRGRSAVRTEWRLLMATHNLTKLHRHLAAAGP